jgi:dsDNA-binding SOS-regulon protein
MRGSRLKKVPVSMWRESLPERVFTGKESQLGGVVRLSADGGGEARSQQAAMVSYLPASQSQAPDSNRKMIRNTSMDLVAKNPADTAEKIRQLAEHLGGFLVKSVTNGQDAQGAFLEVRVPTERFEEARAEIRKLGLRVESERVEAEDVTRQYVDLDARLRNLRGEEAQYLSIMKRANTVKDTLEVSEKLSNVRGQIEQQQAEFQALSKQVETVAINLTLHTEAEAQVFGLHWRPLYQLKLALRDGLNSLGNYATAMAGFLFLLPSILLWLVTILLGAAAGWRILRWASRVFFGWPQSATATQPGH